MDYQQHLGGVSGRKAGCQATCNLGHAFPGLLLLLWALAEQLHVAGETATLTAFKLNLDPKLSLSLWHWPCMPTALLKHVPVLTLQNRFSFSKLAHSNPR